MNRNGLDTKYLRSLNGVYKRTQPSRNLSVGERGLHGKGCRKNVNDKWKNILRRGESIRIMTRV